MNFNFIFDEQKIKISRVCEFQSFYHLFDIMMSGFFFPSKTRFNRIYQAEMTFLIEKYYQEIFHYLHQLVDESLTR